MDQVRGTSGELEGEKGTGWSGAGDIVGTYRVGWHHLWFGVPGGRPDFDPRKITVDGRVRLGDRRFDFRTGRLRFGEEIGNHGADGNLFWTQSTRSRVLCTPDSSYAVKVEIDRISEARPVTTRYDPRTQREDVRTRYRYMEVAITFEHRGTDGSWAVIGRDRRRV